MKKPIVLFTLAAASLLAVPSYAQTFTEVGDAGDLPGNVQLIGNNTAGVSLTQINGALTLTNGISDSDLFLIYISNPATFSVSMNFKPGVNNFDSQLMIFNSSGQGVVANDDNPSGSGSQAAIPAGALTGRTAGVYYLDVSGSGRYATDSSGNLIFPNFTDNTTDPTGVYGPNNPSAVLAGYTGNSNEAGAYALALAGAQFVPVPEFSGVGTFGAAVAALALVRRLRRNAVPV